MTTLKTKLTKLLNIQHPVLLAPMAFASGGVLAAAVSRNGGLGIIGGGYGDRDWLDQQFLLAGNTPVGVGFITWSLQQSPSLLTHVLAHQPVAVMLSFGDPRPFAETIHNAGAKLICQCQNLRHVAEAVEAGADIIVAQGGEAGGHGASRSTLTLVPEVVDDLQQQGSDAVVVAAGGIADGRGLAASLMLGAQGVLMGTRFWASHESLVHDNHRASLLATTGDGTVKTHVADIVRQIQWPAEFSARVRANEFTQRWHGEEQVLEQVAAELEGPYRKAFAAGDADQVGVFFGEAAGLIHSIESVDTIMSGLIADAKDLLGG